MSSLNPQVLSSNTSFFIAFIASFLIYALFFGLFVLWVIDGKFKKEQVLHALLSALVAWAFTQMIKSIFPTLRPFEVNESIPLTFTIPLDGSFPSSHAAIAFAIAGSISLHKRSVGVPFFIIAFLVALGRILSNVHYLSDVVAGGAIGLTTSYFLEKLHVTKLLK